MFSRRLVIKIGRTPTLLLLLSVLTCPCPTNAFPAQSLDDDARNANSFGSPFASAFLPIAPAKVNGNNTLARRQGCPNLTLLCPSGGCCSYDSSCCGNMCCPSGYLCTGGTADAPCCVPITSSDNICVNPCERPGDLLCNGVNICCPPNSLCYYDSFGTARCSPLGGSDNTPTPSPSPTPSPTPTVPASSSFTTPVSSSASSSITTTSSSSYTTTTTSSTTSSSSTTTSSYVPSPPTSNTLSSGAIGGIAGGAAGGVAAIIAIIWIIWYCHKRRKRYVKMEDSRVYKSLPLSKNPKNDKLIRILEILPGNLDDHQPLECKLFVASLHSAVSYEALSYRWKGSQDTKIHVNGAKCLIMENLGSALRYLRQPNTSRFIWCDAICINQSEKKSNREKDEQLLLMGQVYSGAEQVLVWLNKPTPESDRAMEYFAKYPGLEWCGGLPLQIQVNLSYLNHHEWWLAFGKGLLSTDWWGRAWMVQEMILAKKLAFVCGRYTMDESSFFSIAQAGTTQNRTVFDWPKTDNELLLRREAWFRMFYQRVALQGRHGEGFEISPEQMGYGQDGIAQRPRNDIGFWIGQFHEWETTDPKDRVYAYLPLDDNCPIQPSKLPKDLPFTEVFRLVTEYVVTSTGGLDFICLGRAQPRRKLEGTRKGKRSCFSSSRNSHRELPSWVPDLSQPFRSNPPLPPVNFGLRTAFRASNGRPFQGTFDDISSTTKQGDRQRALTLIARRVAAIKEVGVEHRFDNEIEAIEGSMLLAGFGQPPHHPHKTYAYPGIPSQTRHLALSRTLVWDLNHDRRPCVGNEGFFADVDERRVPDNYNAELLSMGFPGERERSFGIDAAWSKYNFRLGRRTALLDNGFIGMVPKACMPMPNSGHLQGNGSNSSSYEVYIFAGASLPMVLRRLPPRDGRNDIFELIGECYVHGVMYGEIYQDTSVQDVVVTLV